MSKNNENLLRKYRMYCRGKGLTKESLKAICDNDLRLFISFIGDKHIAEVTHDDIEDFLLYCQDIRLNGDEALSRKFTSINVFYNTLIKKEIIDIKNPVDKLEKPKVRKKQRGHLTINEYKKLLSYLDGTNDLRGGSIISLFFSSGCRLSEIWQLNRNSLNFENNDFLVVGKGQKERICFFSDDANRRLKKYLNSRNDDLEPLFISRQKNRWSKKAIQDFVKATTKKTGIKKNISPHWLRHTRAMALLEKGANLETIQRLLGHSNIATTQIYAHMNMKRVKSEVDMIDRDL